MYYQTPKVEKYVSFILKRRLGIIGAYILLSLVTLFLYQPKILSSDAMFWLKDSKEFQKTQELNYDTFFLSKLSVSVDKFDDKTQKELQEIQKDILHIPGVKEVSSLFSHTIIERDTQTESSMVGIINVGTLDSYKIKEFVNKLSNPYANFVDKEFHTFHFYITSKENVNIKSLNIKQRYKYMAVDYHIEYKEYLLYLIISIIIIVVLFKSLFSNYISSISALLVISLTTLLTYASINLLTGIKDIYIAMPFISVSIALVDYLFFYYRWHVSQYKADTKHALDKMLNRNISPALWTSFLTTLGLGSLVFINSDIIRLLSLSVIISSIIGYLVNLTFLPSFLSFFHIKHAHVNYAKVCYAFASNELHYNKKFLVAFLITTMALLSYGAFKVYDKNNSFFQLQATNDQLIIMVPYEKIDIRFVASLEKFSEDIMKKFPQSIEEVKSLSKVVKSLNNANSQTDNLDAQALEQTLFYLDLYELTQEYYDANAAKIVISIFDIDKNKLIAWLRSYDALDIYFVDKGALLSNAMYEKIVLLSASLFSALLIIGVITGWIFRTFSMAFVGFIVNAIPIVWFGLFIKLLDIPLNLEMLIAMTISVGLASDATIHFAFKYFRGRYFGRSQKQSLEKMFFYAGIPVIFGSLILVLIFGLLGISNVSTLKDIGLYSAVLILMSLFTDLFILPVILLLLDKFNKTLKKRAL